MGGTGVRTGDPELGKLVFYKLNYHRSLPGIYQRLSGNTLSLR
jgi:hypothetical protein